MAEVGPTGLPLGTFDLKIGSSYAKGRKKTEYHTLRYDFKPKSIGKQTETFIGIGPSEEVQIAITSENKDDLTTYKGAKKPIKDGKECLLIFDESTGKMRLEKIASNMNVKQTRKTNDDTNSFFKEEVLKMRKHRPKPSTSPSKHTGSSSPSKHRSSHHKHEDKNDKPKDCKLNKDKPKDVNHMSSSSESDSSSTDSSDSSDESENEETTKKPETSTEQPRNRLESSNFSSDDEAALEKHLNASQSQTKDTPPEKSQLKSQEQVDSLFDDMDMPDLTAQSPPKQKAIQPISSSSISTSSSKKPEKPNQNQMLLQNDLVLSESSDED